MQQPKQPVQPLARSIAPDPLEWDHVERRNLDLGKDVLGLSPADRQALGLSAPRPLDLEAPGLGGAEHALADVLARGGAIAPSRSKADLYVPSGVIGKADPRRKR